MNTRQQFSLRSEIKTDVKIKHWMQPSDSNVRSMSCAEAEVNNNK